MKRTNDLPDLSRTVAAIAAYDLYNENDTNFADMNNEDTLAAYAKLEALGEAVGVAYGLDTADRNGMSACWAGIRPGHRIPGPGCELSFVRRMVAQWESRKCQKLNLM